MALRYSSVQEPILRVSISTDLYNLSKLLLVSWYQFFCTLGGTWSFFYKSKICFKNFKYIVISPKFSESYNIPRYFGKDSLTDWSLFPEILIIRNIQECWPCDQESSQCRAAQPNRDEISHTTFQLLWANLLNHWHLITKLFTMQLIALVLEMKWLWFSDLPILQIFMPFICLLTSTTFTELTGQSFSEKPLHCDSWWNWSNSMSMNYGLSGVSPVTWETRLARASLISEWYAEIFKTECHDAHKTYYQDYSKLLNLSSTCWEFTLQSLDFSKVSLTANTAECAWKLHTGVLNYVMRRERGKGAQWNLCHRIFSQLHVLNVTICAFCTILSEVFTHV